MHSNSEQVIALLYTMTG